MAGSRNHNYPQRRKSYSQPREPRNYDQPRKPDRKCPYGFTCGNHPWGQYKITKDCKYYDKCKAIVKTLTEASLNNIEEYLDESRKESIEFHRESTSYNHDHYNKYYRDMVKLLKAIEKHERAVIFLRKRGNHQTFESLGVNEQISQVKESLKQLESKLRKLDRGYIAPEGVEVNTYKVKRYPYGKLSGQNQKQKVVEYEYHNLKSKTAQFESETEIDQKCKVIHLGKSDGEKNIQGRLGIERRNRLLKIRTRLIRALNALQEAAELADVELNFDDFTGDTKGESQELKSD